MPSRLVELPHGSFQTGQVGWIVDDFQSSMLVESGAPVSVAQAQLGHADASVTLGIYSHVNGDSQRRAVEKVAGILGYSGLQTKAKTQLIQ